MTNGASFVLSEVPGNIGGIKSRLSGCTNSSGQGRRYSIRCKEQRYGGHPRLWVSAAMRGGWTEEGQARGELFPGRGRVVLQKFCDRLVQILLTLVRLCFRVEGFAGGTSPYEVFVRGVVHIQRELSDVDLVVENRVGKFCTEAVCAGSAKESVE